MELTIRLSTSLTPYGLSEERFAKTRTMRRSRALILAKLRTALGLVLLLAFTTFNVACEVDMTVTLDGNNPPTVSLAGSGNLMFFSVMEVLPENQHQSIQRSSDNNQLLWKIQPFKRCGGQNSVSSIYYVRNSSGRLQTGISRRRFFTSAFEQRQGFRSRGDSVQLKRRAHMV